MDSATKISDIEACQEYAKQQDISLRSLPHYDTMEYMIDVKQPTLEYFKALNAAMAGEYLICYVEIAMDILTKSKIKKDMLDKILRNLLIRQMKSNQQAFPYGIAGDTLYFGKRLSKYPVMVYYADKKSKLKPDHYCCHIEMRLQDTGIVKAQRLYTFADLINFEHELFWEQYLDLRTVNYTKLGRLATDGNKSDPTFLRNGLKLLNSYKCAQALLNERPDLLTALSPVTGKRMFEGLLKKEGL